MVSVSSVILQFKINIISLRISVTGKDELDKLVCAKHMGLHSSVGTALEAMSSNSVEALKIYFGLKFIIAHCDYNWGDLHFIKDWPCYK